MGQANVALVIDTRGAISPLRQVDAQAKKFDKTIKGTGGKLKDTNRSLGMFGKTTKFAGNASAGAAAKVGLLGAAVNTVLAPLAVFTGAAALAAKTATELSGIDFNLRKWETLTGGAGELHENLKAVSNELNNSVSTADLVAGSYDVASAGFTKAADAALILKNAALGAKGGFSDMETTSGAIVKVLNAYGLEAKESTRLMDMFVQTQNDGIITVDAYAQNIGKVASVASMLKIPLSEVNAVIAQSTATGVNAEVAFTGMKTAMIKLTSSRGAKKLEKWGLDINAATIEADGLLGTLKKMEGLDPKAISDIFGAEAIQVMAPVLNNLEKYERLIKNQSGAVGTAEIAHDKMHQTIKGAWDEMTNIISNAFTDSSELGELLKNLIQATTVGLKLIGFVLGPTVEKINKIFNWLNGIVDNIKWLKNQAGDLLQKWWGVTPSPTVEVVPQDPTKEGNNPKDKEKDAVEGINRALEKQQAIQKMLKEGWEEIGQTIGEGLHGAIRGLIEGTQTLKESLTNIALSIANMIVDLMIAAALKQALGGTSFGSFLGFANGGQPPVGKPSIVGENGPELFVPRQAGSVIPNDELGGGGSMNVNVNVDATGSAAEGDADKSTQLGKLLGAAVQAELVRQKRPGGLLAV